MSRTSRPKADADGQTKAEILRDVQDAMAKAAVLFAALSFDDSDIEGEPAEVQDDADRFAVSDPEVTE